MANESMSTVQIDLVEGMQFVARAEGSGGTIVMDGSPDFGGVSSAARPMEVLLMALAGCTGMDVISILRKKRQRVSRMRVVVHGQRAEEHPRRYERIELEFIVRGWAVDDAAVARSIELSREKYCGVTASLNSEVVTSFRVEEEAPEV